MERLLATAKGRVMARFRIFLIASPQPIDVDLPYASITELNAVASCSRFLEGHMAEADHDGVCPGVLVPTCRLHMVVEAD